MPRSLDPELRRALAARIRYYNELGIYDFYQRPVSAGENGSACMETPFSGQDSQAVAATIES